MGLMRGNKRAVSEGIGSSLSTAFLFVFSQIIAKVGSSHNVFEAGLHFFFDNLLFSLLLFISPYYTIYTGGLFDHFSAGKANATS